MRAPLLLVGLAALASTLLYTPKAEAFSFIQRFGCPGDTGAAWPDRLLPSRWKVDQQGHSELPMGEVVDVFERSIGAWGGAWERPCCSGFTQAFGGLTSETPLDSEEENVVGFAEASWPRFLGSRWAVIAVTLPEIEPGSCELHAADMLFNAVTFEFRTDGRLDAQNAVDFESIAVHEFGHWIGLDHSVDPTSSAGYLAETVMFPSYRGGTDDRALYLDDKLGACALYPASCGACQADGDCPDGQACRDGACEQVACTRDAQCPMGSTCGEDGRCHRGCRLHVECGEGFYCAEGACLPDGACMACESCRRSRDCGAGDYFCAEVGEDRGLCTKYCTNDSECGGDSVCHLQQGGMGFCGAPGSAFCPDGYTCDDAACPALGRPCSTSCGDRSDTCVATDAGAICSCTCSSDRDCDGGRCLTDPASGLPSCYPREGTTPCGDSHCPDGAVCVDGSCQGLCNGARCGAGEICERGRCEALCPDCAAGEVCDPVRRSCVPDESCLGVPCGSGERCVDGACHLACGDGVCAEGQRCEGGACVKAERPGGGGCGAAGGGPDLAAPLLFLALYAGGRRARRIP